MTRPPLVRVSCCFRWDCPNCRERNYAEPVPCTPEETAQILAEEGDDEGEDWKPKAEREWTPEFGKIPAQATCRRCSQVVAVEEDG